MRYGHLLAGVGAAATVLRARVHHVVARELVTVLRAALADRGTSSTGAAVLIRAPQHEVGRGLTDVGAIEEECHVSLACVTISLFQAVRQR